MLDERKAADMAAYLIAKAGAAGLSRRMLLVLLYLTERDAINSRGVSISGDEFVLTPFGPVMRMTSSNILGGPEKAGQLWTRRMEWVAEVQPSTVAAEVVAEAGAVYNGAITVDAVRLRLRHPQPASPYSDGSHWGSAEGMPYLGALSRHDRGRLSAVWEENGWLDEHELCRQALLLPEVGGRTSGELDYRSVLEALGFSAERIELDIEAEEESKAVNKYRADRNRGSGELEDDGGYEGDAG